MNTYSYVHFIKIKGGEKKLYASAEQFKIFGDSTRVKILYALFASEMCI